jgi:Zn-dependent peptidase ImmA (M78 family)/transcriptional regulator with XRE-family HTH domain
VIGADDLFSASHLFDPARLTVARELKGLTKTELAELVEKTPSALSQFEAGRARPDPQTLRRIALALGLPIAFFTRRRSASLIPLDACHFRSLRSATQRDRRRLLAIAMLLCELVAEVEDFVELPIDQISPLASAAATTEDIEELATQVRRSWGLGLGPITNVVRLLEAKGAIVARIVDGCEEVDAFSLWHSNRPLVFLVMEKHSASRSRFDAAHELGHLVMHADVAPASQEVERQANRFASAFLMPREVFLQECPRRLVWGHVEELKRRWKVSLGAIVRRGYDLGCFSEATYRRACVYLNQTYNAGGVRRPEPYEPQLESPTVIADAIAALEESDPLEAIAERLGLSASAVKMLL